MQVKTVGFFILVAPLAHAGTVAAPLPQESLPLLQTQPENAAVVSQSDPSLEPAQISEPQASAPAVVPPQSEPSRAMQTTASNSEQTAGVNQAAAPQTAPSVQPAAPLAQQPQQTIAPLPAQDDSEITSIDDSVSIAEGKGNWLYKRIWWEKAERLYEKTKQLADRILESRVSYYARKTDIDTMLQEFYVNIGMQQGELIEAINFYNEQAQTATNESNNSSQQKIIVAAVDQKKNLQLLQNSTVAVSKIASAIDDALMKLSEQLTIVKQYEQQSWQCFKEINKELNDKKARELYYAMDTYWKNINAINTYLTDPFSKYFDQITSKLQADTESIKTIMQSLSEHGISIIKYPMVKNGEKKSDESPLESEAESTGFLGRIWGWITYPFSAFGNFIGSWFSSSTPSEENEAS